MTEYVYMNKHGELAFVWVSYELDLILEKKCPACGMITRTWIDLCEFKKWPELLGEL